MSGHTEITITPWSRASIGTDMTADAVTVPISAAWPTASAAIYIPFYLSRGATVVKAFIFNGAAVSGNVDIGIYGATTFGAGTKLVSIGSTAQAGTNALQSFDITDTVLGVGLYYMAMAIDNITGTTFRVQDGSSERLKGLGVQSQLTAFALPATATPVNGGISAGSNVPMFGLILRTLV